MTRLSQRDPRWGNIPLGFSNTYNLITRIPTILGTIYSFIALKISDLPLTGVTGRLYNSTSKGWILPRMFRSRNKLEIIYSVIIPNVVNMMHSFIISQFSTNSLFHNISMFKQSLSIHSNNTISIYSRASCFVATIPSRHTLIVHHSLI